MAIADKLQSILDSKSSIKAAIEAKGVTDVGDVLSTYADKIASISTSSGGSTGYTGHADVEGLKAIGWTDEDIAFFQEHGVDWNEEDDDLYKVSLDNIDLYGVITVDNIGEYKDIIFYLPKIELRSDIIPEFTNLCLNFYNLIGIPLLETSHITTMSGWFFECRNLRAIPPLDTSNVTNMNNLFSNCTRLRYVSPLNMSKVEDAQHMFSYCQSLIEVPQINTANVKKIDFLFSYTSITKVENIDTTNAELNTMSFVFFGCYSLSTILDFDYKGNTEYTMMFDNCFGLKTAYIRNIAGYVTIPSSVLSKESILFIINNASKDTHSNLNLGYQCYNKYKDDLDIIQALTENPNVSLGSI